MGARVVGLCGPIGSGKTLCLQAARELGWETLEVDRLAHGLYAAGTGLSREIFAAFGDGMRAPDGSVDRKALGTVVFADPGEMRRLEALVHPAVHRAMDEAVAGARARGANLLLEAAILPRRPDFCAGLDAVVAVSAPDEVRLARVMERDGISREAAQDRMARAVSPEEIGKVATHGLENGLDREAFLEAARTLLGRI